MSGPGTSSSPLGKDAIEKIATRVGFEVHWEDANKRTQRVRPETLATLLNALGLPCATADEARQTLAMLDAERASQTLPPLVTAECHRATAIPVSPNRSGVAYRIELENGGIVEGRLGLPKGETALLAPIAEPGYHTLEFGDQRVRLAVAPQRCYTVQDACRDAATANGKRARRSDADAPRAAAIWGIGAQLYGLRRAGDGGIGDFTALAQFARRSAAEGADALAISPTHAMFSADPHKFSPYAPSSRLFLNVGHIDPSAVLGQQAFEAALDTVSADGGASPRQQWAALEALPLIDWPGGLRLRLTLLRALYEQFCRHERIAAAPLAKEFEAFRTRGARALEDHARFEAIDALQRGSHGIGHWRDWPAALTDPRRPEVDEFAREHRHEVDFHVFLQWLAAKGLSGAHQAAREGGMAIGLVADLAVGCDGAGSHAWSYPDDMLRGVSVGAPPDLFNQAGQAWGLTTFSPRAMRMQGFSAFIDMLRATFAYGGGLRIDHVLGLQRLWLVPEGASAADGAYLRYPITDLLRLIALESARHRAIVVGEDLGTVPEGFRERLARHGLLGMSVLWFERSEDGGSFTPPARWSRTSLAMTTTHDLPTVAGWWSGHDIVWRDKIGQTAPRADGRDPVALANAERAADRHALWRAFQQAGVAPADVGAPPKEQAPVDEALAFVASTPAPLALYPLEDLLGLAEQPNLPGSVDEHPNWRRRLAAPIDALFGGGALTDRLLALASRRTSAARPRNGPAPEPSRTP
ncbi:4-alpha-glucanotransferase [Trinickia diaoshuihuensis]|uniref:4-alpha-glucanotransferase n=1 Tax=Trinickia diaoshuihuensis TaxID=2292265 RepID=UPI000E2809C5|nr:4-alpha-glucanotransferase [Trinickia diaoshuihuensis]